MPATPALKHKAADVADGQLGRTVQRHGHMVPRDAEGAVPRRAPDLQQRADPNAARSTQPSSRTA